MIGGSPEVSIILPTYNGARYIQQSIDSCLNQTYKNIELIIVDDGSTDETSQIVKSYNDKRIRYIRHNKNVGLPEALNTGFAKARGEFLTWTSDDNRYLPTAIEEMLTFLKKNEGIDLVYADYWAHYLDSGEEELRQMPDVLNMATENGVGACFLYTRKVYNEIGDYDPAYRLVEDYEYWMRICSKFKAKHYSKPLFIYGEHSKSLKSTRHISISLRKAALRYRRKYISFSGLQKSFIDSFYEKNDITLPKKFLLFLSATVSISRLSSRLSAVYLALLIRISASAFLIFYVESFLMPPLKNVEFLFLIKPRLTNLAYRQKQKNVLCIVPYIVLGGAEKVLLNIVIGMKSEEYAFNLMTTSPSDNIWRGKFEAVFQNVVIPNNGAKPTFQYNKLYYKYIQYLIKELKIDIVLITNSTIGYQFLPRLKSEFRNVRIVDLLHAENYPKVDLESMAPYIDRRICISKRLRNHLVDQYRKRNIDRKYIDRIDVIHNGIDVRDYSVSKFKKGTFKTKFLIPNENRIVAFIGRFREEKDPFLFVEIAKQLIAEIPNKLSFVMAGDGPDFEKVKSSIKNYGLSKHFVLTGAIENVAELLNDTFALLVVSKNEGIPLVILEAMSMGVSVISTNVGAINEVIQDNENGFLINPENSLEEIINAFTSRTLDLLDGRINYDLLSEKATKAINSNLTLEIMASKYQNVFQELTQKSPPNKISSLIKQTIC